MIEYYKVQKNKYINSKSTQQNNQIYVLEPRDTKSDGKLSDGLE